MQLSGAACYGASPLCFLVWAILNFASKFDIEYDVSIHNNNPIRRGTIGVIARDQRLLLVQRAHSVSKGGFWCFPGGHVEKHENSRAAVRRELKEELGIDIEPAVRLGSLRVLDTRHVLSVWKVNHRSGDIRPAASEIADFAWLTVNEIVSLEKGLPSNMRVIEMLRVFGHAQP